MNYFHANALPFNWVTLLQPMALSTLSNHRKRKASEIFQGPNGTDVPLNELFFKSEESVNWYSNIIFRKRNIIWKAIKSIKLGFSGTHKILQNKYLTDLSQLQALESIHNDEPPVKRRCISSTSLKIDTNDNHRNMKKDDSDSSSSDSDDEFKWDDDEWDDDEWDDDEWDDDEWDDDEWDDDEWDDNEEIIAHTLTELNTLEHNESSQPLRKHRRSKRDTQISDISDLPREILEDMNLLKYWFNRYEIFHKYDEGIKLDRESWYSVTPERIAKQIAKRCECNVIIDAFCGAGGNTIQFALTCNKVIAIDIDPKKIECARNNAKVYGVEDKIEFMIGDFLELAPKLKADVVFLSPPWGGPGYSKSRVFDIKWLLPVDGKDIYETARRISTSVAYFLPKNVNVRQVRMLATKGHGIETEQYFERDRIIATTCYYGELVTKTKNE